MTSPDTSPDRSVPTPSRRDLLPFFKNLNSVVYLVAVGWLYVCGFLVLNAHLAKFGILDVDFINARYFLAGANFLFYLICFYLFAGRAVMFSPKWLGQELERLNRSRSQPIWSVVVFLHSFLNSFFFLCLSAAMFTALAIDASEPARFYAVLGVGFVVVYTLDTTNLDVRYPKTSETCAILVKVFAIFSFFANSSSLVLLSAFFSYFGIFVFINLVLDTFDRHKTTGDKIAFTGVYALVALLGGAIAYGVLFFGKVSSTFGGARPTAVVAGLTNEAHEALPSTAATPTAQALEGQLVHQTASFTYISTSGRTIRLRTADIVVLVVTPEPEKTLPQSFAEPVSTGPGPTKSSTPSSK